MDLAELGDAIEANDPDWLLRLINRGCGEQDWEGIMTLRGHCYAAMSTGRQLWGPAHHAEYRLALEAPGSFAGPMVAEDLRGLSLGPLTEVAASTHTWQDLKDHLPEGPSREVYAHERVVRGEDLSSENDLQTDVLDIPLVLADWEPSYEVATYHADRAEFPAPPRPTLEPVALSESPTQVDQFEGTEALHRLVRTWTTESNGRAEAVAVKGSAPEAVAAFGLREARMAPITVAEAFAEMAWASANGGAHGKRAGAGAGRFGAWWAGAAITGLLDEWPPPAQVLGKAIDKLRWFQWSDLVEPTGWDLHLAIHDPEANLSWAISATDAD